MKEPHPRASEGELRAALEQAQTIDDMVVILAERTDLSPNQAVGLARAHGANPGRLAYEASLFRAEG